MSSLTRTIARSIARKNGTLKPSRGRSPSYRGQIFHPQASPKKNDNLVAEFFKNLFKRRETK